MSLKLRYVILRHEGIDDPHFDLMFETAPGSELETWRVTEWPAHDGTAIAYLKPHRRAYLDYEGPLSGNRGHVRRIHVGTHTLIENQPAVLVVKLETESVLALPRAQSAHVQVTGA